jgi:hypothetical protein
MIDAQITLTRVRSGAHRQSGFANYLLPLNPFPLKLTFITTSDALGRLGRVL